MASGLSFSSKSRLVNLTLTQRSRRAIILMLVSTLLAGVCGLRLAQLQILQGQYNRQRAEQNRIALIPIPSDRGNILDRNGKLLAANRLSRSVYLRPREQSKEEWKQTAERLSPILKIPAGEILDKLKPDTALPCPCESAEIWPSMPSLPLPKTPVIFRDSKFGESPADIIRMARWRLMCWVI